MRTATAAAAVAVVALALLAGVLLLASVPDDAGSDDPVPRLEQRWVSDTTTSVGGNHHEPAVVTVADATGSDGDDAVDNDGDAGAAGDGDDAASGDDTDDRADASAADRLVLVPLNGGNEDCRLVAVDAGSGEPVWRHQVPPADCNAHAVGDVAVDRYPGQQRSVLLATGEERALALAPDDGEERAAAPIDGFGYSPPVVVGEDTLVVTSFFGNVTAVAPDGSQRWHHAFDAAVWERPLVAPDGDGGRRIVVAGGSTGESGLVRALEVDGSEAWTARFDRPVRSAEQTTVDGEPVVVAASVRGTVVALDASDGEQRWQRSFGEYTRLAVDDGAIYATDARGTVRKLASADGETRWERPTEREFEVATHVAVADGGEAGTAPVVLEPDGRVRVLDPGDGSTLAEREVDGRLLAPPATSDLDGDGVDEAVVVYGDGRTAALDLSNAFE